jgi:hypothetical protein
MQINTLYINTPIDLFIDILITMIRLSWLICLSAYLVSLNLVIPMVVKSLLSSLSETL